MPKRDLNDLSLELLGNTLNKNEDGFIPVILWNKQKEGFELYFYPPKQFEKLDNTEQINWTQFKKHQKDLNRKQELNKKTNKMS